MNQGVKVGLGSASRNTSSTGRRTPIEIGIVCGEQHYCCHRFILAYGTCL